MKETGLIELNGFKFTIEFRRSVQPANRWWISLVNHPEYRFSEALDERFNDYTAEAIARDKDIIRHLEAAVGRI